MTHPSDGERRGGWVRGADDEPEPQHVQPPLSDRELMTFRILVLVLQMACRVVTSLVYLSIFSAVTGLGTWFFAHSGWRWPGKH